jgi:general secretion pathway protein C
MGFDGFAKRYMPLAICLMLAVAAYFQASGLGQLIGALLAPSSMIGGPRGRGPLPPLEPSDARDLTATAILARNAFDSVTGPIGDPPQGPAQAPVTTTPGADWYADPPCEIARAVLIASSDDPDWSFAAILGPDGKTALRRKGDDFYGGKVTFVGDARDPHDRNPHDRRLWDRVWLTAPNGMRCQLQLGAKPPKMMGGPPGMGAPPPQQPPPSGPNAELLKKIRKTGEHAYEVDRTALDALIANPAELMKTRVVPDKVDGQVVGLKLYGIKQDSVLGAIGLENGDRLSSINGFDMNDPQKMLEAYTKLMHADHVTASVVRNGKPVNLDFAIK